MANRTLGAMVIFCALVMPLGGAAQDMTFSVDDSGGSAAGASAPRIR